MLKNLLLLGLASFAVAQSEDESQADESSASVTDDEMGPAAFMWPPDRVWSGDMDNQAPCGSRASPGNRTDFPINPESNDDFETLIENKSISDLNPGHTCVELDKLSSSVKAGDKATLQVIYRADWDAPHNQTFYACADITFVEESNFNFKIPCFNATEPGEDDQAAGATVNPTATATHKSTSSHGSDSSSDESSSDSSSSGGSSKLSGGAIAGIVIGSIAGAALILGAAFFLWRRRQQKQRTERLRVMENRARGDDIPLPKRSGSQTSGV
ncbi:WSC2 Glucoamylase III (alpha-14-glucan-glucosidase) [Fusarium albosuccineum]|uniref:WSC2 Glucoamylase III (Alpha-14-glucan-glucosidase) n=1 Tax=Fusarium albosuccineum TaxID=1237068 RepID=A0A8H4PHR4_9HYPO|nr:WSC2 Glucoamylase III (alpha-14-glucan-glucosidase) [Fusarium albosuccineum]